MSSEFQLRLFEFKCFHLFPFVFRIVLEDVKAVLIVNISTHPYADRIVSADGRILVFLFPTNTAALIKPMDQGVLMACKRLFQSILES